MTKFEFFMVFYGLLLGLALAELLTGIGNLLRRREHPRWGVVTPLAIAMVFICVITAFSDAWGQMQHVAITLQAFMAPVGIGVSLFLAASMTLPRDIAEWSNLDSYFFARRRLIFGPIISYSLILDFALEIPHMLDKGGLSLSYVVVNSILTMLLAVGALAKSRFIVISSMICYITGMVTIYLGGQSIQQQFSQLFGF